jgi:ST7 protein.
MDRKKPKKKNRKSTKRKASASPPFRDRRAMEKTMVDTGRLLSEHDFGSIDEANAFLQDMIASGGPPPSLKRTLTPLEQAQDVMYEAWDSSGKRRVKLARQALSISEDCADAYVLLAEETARSLSDARDLYGQGVKAGERALGPQAFEEDIGHFWGIIESRPYMRARAGLAQCLWMLGERQRAIEHYTEMLRLNPSDNQGIRYLLVNCLLEEGCDEAVGKLLDQYEGDATATWLYSHALWMFCREGASSKAKARLREALNHNRYVPRYILGRKRLPRRLPEYVGFGDKNEAIVYAAEAIVVWQKTPGAVEWLTSNLHNNVE